MTDKQRTLAKALHTVTSVKNVAAYLAANEVKHHKRTRRTSTLNALFVLGYTEAEAKRNPDLLEACIRAVVK